MREVQRVLLVSESKSCSLLYGHVVKWIVSELDYVCSSWKSYNEGSVVVSYKDVEDPNFLGDALASGCVEISSNSGKNIEFNFPESEEFFIEKSNDEENFSPFISLCSSAKVYFSNEFDVGLGPVDYLEKERNVFEVIKEKYHIDLFKYPHLLGSFTVYTPTRIDESFKGFESGGLSGYEIALYDYFEIYKGAIVTVESFSGELINTESFCLDGELHRVECGFVPDKQVTTVRLSGDVIYRSSYFLIKSIGINTTINSQKIIRYNDRVIKQSISDRNSFDV